MHSFKTDHKCAGLLVPAFALRHSEDFGIGDTQSMRDAIDFCSAHGFSVLQTLPIHETVGDHSPYNPVSSRALSPALLTLTEEEVPGLTKSMLRQAAPEAWLAQLRAGPVKHNSVQPLKLHILLAAHRNFLAVQDEGSDLRKQFADFQKQNSAWLEAYTLFRLLVREYEGNAQWAEWRPEHQLVTAAEAWFASHPDREGLHDTREGFAYIQWVGWRQWGAVRSHADAKGVLLMGEMSFGVAKTSADVWAAPELFDCDWNMGTRPIVYFDTNKDSERWGQNWGLPAYRWENHRSSAFAWLRSRVKGEKQFFHICRLDHLRGYFRGYMFPWTGGARHAEFAQLTEDEVQRRTGGRLPRFVPGPDDDPVSQQMNDLQGREIISVIREAAGDMYLFAEIMGNMPPYMRQALDDLQMPSLVFPQLERAEDRSLLPTTDYRKLSLGAYANHDHAPMAAFYNQLRDEAKKDEAGNAAIDLTNLLRFAGWTEKPPDTLDDGLLAALQRALFQTPCQLTVLMSSDLLGIPQRFNLPGSYGTQTWSERLEHSLAEFERHPLFGPRISLVQRLIREEKRIPLEQ